MSEPTPIALNSASDSEAAAPARGRRSRGIVRRIAIGFVTTLVALLLLAVALYEFGGMWVRTPEMRTAYDDLVTAGQATPIERRFVIPVPGCVCHSDDPVEQAQHSTWRIRECAECH